MFPSVRTCFTAKGFIVYMCMGLLLAIRLKNKELHWVYCAKNLVYTKTDYARQPFPKKTSLKYTIVYYINIVISIVP